MENNDSKFDQVATWVGSTVSSAFFSSLERFSCVNIATSDPDYDDDDDDYSSATTTPTTVATPTSVTTPTAVTVTATASVNNTNPSVQNKNDVTNLPV